MDAQTGKWIVYISGLKNKKSRLFNSEVEANNFIKQIKIKYER